MEETVGGCFFSEHSVQNKFFWYTE